MNVLVLGASVMAGHVVAIYLRENGFTVDTLAAHHKLDKDTQLIDITNQAKLESFLAKNNFLVVLILIGVKMQKKENQVHVPNHIVCFFEKNL